ncbi:unnamed protein product [Closterium sp. Yama58-4]|nr:unnamed protein product [Closterium sp. Yama58-4]
MSRPAGYKSSGQLHERKHSPVASSSSPFVPNNTSSNPRIPSSNLSNPRSVLQTHHAYYSSPTDNGDSDDARETSGARAFGFASSAVLSSRARATVAAVAGHLQRVRATVAVRLSRLSRDQAAGLVALALWAALWLQDEVQLLAAPQGTCPSLPDFPPEEADVLGRVPQYGKFDLSAPMVGKYLKLIHKYLEPWQPIPGIESGLGHKGFVTPEALYRLARQPSVMSCSGHVKVINGKVFFRYGGFWHVYYRLNRFLQTVKMIQDAIDVYGLTDLRLEMIVNTCDHPQSFYSSHWSDRAGYPVMSMGFTVDTMDIPIPDPLDLTEDYTPDLSTQVPWERKEARAVFRGKTTNFDMLDGNWGANPRVRLHRLSDVHSALMEAHINAWSHAKPAVIKAMAEDGLLLAKRMNFTQFNAFKYQVRGAVSDGSLRGGRERWGVREGENEGGTCSGLHRLSDVHLALMEAHINAWSHAKPAAIKAMAEDGLLLAKRMNFTQFNAFKYQVGSVGRGGVLSALMEAHINAWSHAKPAVSPAMAEDGELLAKRMNFDGGRGSCRTCRTCGVLRSNQLSIRQETPLFQFYEPLLEDGVHWLVTTRTFSDLPAKIRWAQENDDAAQRLVHAANHMAQYACTWSGRRLYWALLLVKYHDVLQDPSAITEPTANEICTKQPLLQPPPNATNPALVHCADPDAPKHQPDCAFFCAKATIPDSGLIWLRADVLRGLKKIGPP